MPMHTDVAFSWGTAESRTTGLSCFWLRLRLQFCITRFIPVVARAPPVRHHKFPATRKTHMSQQSPTGLQHATRDSRIGVRSVESNELAKAHDRPFATILGDLCEQAVIADATCTKRLRQVEQVAPARDEC